MKHVGYEISKAEKKRKKGHRYIIFNVKINGDIRYKGRNRRKIRAKETSPNSGIYKLVVFPSILKNKTQLDVEKLERTARENEVSFEEIRK